MGGGRPVRRVVGRAVGAAVGRPASCIGTRTRWRAGGPAVWAADGRTVGRPEVPTGRGGRGRRSGERAMSGRPRPGDGRGSSCGSDVCAGTDSEGLDAVGGGDPFDRPPGPAWRGSPEPPQTFLEHDGEQEASPGKMSGNVVAWVVGGPGGSVRGFRTRLSRHVPPPNSGIS